LSDSTTFSPLLKKLLAAMEEMEADTVEATRTAH
jgi:hypothetical protein